MWPFLSRNRSKPSEESDQPILKFTRLQAGLNPDMFNIENRAALKFWLPDLAAEAIEELAGLQGITMSALLREFFLVHVYGAYVVACLKQQHPDCLKDHQVFFSKDFSIKESGYVKKRVATFWVPELGKNTAPIKVWIPKVLKSDLQILADHSDIKLSQYAREISISRLLGHGTLPMRYKMLEATPLPDADKWCDDETVAMKQIDRQTHKVFANTDVEIRERDIE